MTETNIKMALSRLDELIQEAGTQLEEWITTDNEYLEPDWITESCFLQLLALAEAIGLSSYHKMLLAEYSKVSSSNKGFHDWKLSPDREPYSTVLARIRCFKRALDGFYPDEPIIKITKDVLQILRDVHYSIADPKVFGAPSANESDVHLRIESILKCIFPDLKHEPTLTKQIKNFKPDTGIPSIRTLIEYKYLEKSDDAKTIADQILADTRGYTSTDWKRVIYVIYETHRFRKESEWNQLLRESGVPESACVVVLSGEPLKVVGQKMARIRKARNGSHRAVKRVSH